MKEGRLQDLDLKEGDVVICQNTSPTCTHFTIGNEYKASKNTVGKIGIFDNDGNFMITTLSSTFKKKQHPLRNVKIDLRKPDGSIDQELGRAFQEAVIESDGFWVIGCRLMNFIQKPYLYVSSEGAITDGRNGAHFKNKRCQEIAFTYERKLTYTVEPVNTKEKELNNLIAKLSSQIEEAKTEISKFRSEK
jgi:hypothetical protein